MKDPVTILVVVILLIVITQQMALSRLFKVLRWVLQNVTIVSSNLSDQKQLEQVMRHLGLQKGGSGNKKDSN